MQQNKRNGINERFLKILEKICQMNKQAKFTGNVVHFLCPFLSVQ